MAVNIDTVYQRVLAIANKEQRGYITPQEFNLFANQTQMDIFEQYFYDLNQYSRGYGNDTVYADMVSIIEEKIQIFEEYADINVTNVAIDTTDDSNRTYLLNTPPLSRIHRLDQLIVNDRTVEIVNNKNFNRFERYNQANQAPLYKPSANRPIGTMYRSTSDPNFMQIQLSNAGQLEIYYIRRPVLVRWGYDVIGSDALYDPTISTNFELHASDQGELVNRILVYAGVSIQKPDITQAAASLEGQKQQQEKQ